jgi:hypothetical protein
MSVVRPDSAGGWAARVVRAAVTPRGNISRGTQTNGTKQPSNHKTMRDLMRHRECAPPGEGVRVGTREL